MTQLLLALALAWGLPVPETGTASPGYTSVRSGQTAPTARERLVITEATTILLDGRRCRYDQVPAQSVITFAEVGPDRQTVLRIHFRRAK
jgi:hypothetical protein